MPDHPGICLRYMSTDRAAQVLEQHGECLGRRIRERRSSVAVLLCGTSGTGKSTLASLLAARLGITTLLSTVRLGPVAAATADKNPWC